MQKPSDSQEYWAAQREKIIGLGERSFRKTYYPELQQRLDELERFRALLDQSNDCIFVFHASSLSFVDVNESACRQLGYSSEELISNHLGKYLSEDTVARIEELASAGPGLERNTLATELRKSSAEWLPVEITIGLVTFNKTLYGVAVARDITERKRAEAVLLENSRMLRDMELARQIQLSQLPIAPPLLPGVGLAGCCVPAAHVGGDYYDYFRRENGIVDMVVADVSGHSIGAALMTSEVRSVLRANVHLFDSSGAILAALNDILYEDLNRAGLLITFFYLKYDVATRTLTYSNAGHVPPLLLSGSRGECLDLDAEGLILGVRKGVAFEEKRIVLEAGDLLLLHTDGISEAQDGSGEMFGRDRLSEILKARREEEPDEIIAAVLREVTAFAGAQNLEDDVTMIVMKVA